MRSTIIKYGIMVFMVVFSGSVLMNVSRNVQRAEREVARINAKIDKEKEAIRVLKAEWAYLNNPARLEVFAVSGLELNPADVKALMSDFEVFEEKDLDASASVFVPPRDPRIRDISYGQVKAGVSNASYGNGGHE